MKVREKEEARRLRNCGLSLGKIAGTVGVSKSTVSGWVKDIILSTDQMESLVIRPNREATKVWTEQSRQRRIYYQSLGMTRVNKQDWKFIAGCLLYWAEGGKSRHTVQFNNSDPNMLSLFRDFLVETMVVPLTDISIYIHLHANGTIDGNGAENFWLNRLRLDASSLRKTTIVTQHPMSKGTKKGKLPYGMCCLTVNRTDIVQQIFGGIKAYASIEDSELWL